MSKKFTVQQIINAIRKNGYKKATGVYWRDAGRNPLTSTEEGSRDKVVYACAIGQAALNLGVGPVYLDRGLQKSRYDGSSDLSWSIVSMNDHKKMSLEAIADALEKDFSEYLDVIIEVEEY